MSVGKRAFHNLWLLLTYRYTNMGQKTFFLFDVRIAKINCPKLTPLYLEMDCHRVPCCLVTALYKHCLLLQPASNVIAYGGQQAGVDFNESERAFGSDVRRSHEFWVKLDAKPQENSHSSKHLLIVIKFWTLTLLQVDQEIRKTKFLKHQLQSWLSESSHFTSFCIN